LSPPIYHRDIKPSNLIWGDDDRVHLVDFGAVQDKAPIMGATFTVVGTYGYTPIEQFAGRAVPASDLYALGATLVHLSTGRSPADLEQKDFRLQFVQFVTLPVPLLQWLTRMVEPGVGDRFPKADRALEALLVDGSLMAQKQGRLGRRAPQNIVPKPLGTKISVQNTGDRLVVSTALPKMKPLFGSTFIFRTAEEKKTTYLLIVGVVILLAAFMTLINPILFSLVAFIIICPMIVATILFVLVSNVVNGQRAWFIILDTRNYITYEKSSTHRERQLNYNRGLLNEVQEVIHHDLKTEMITQETSRIIAHGRVVTMRTDRVEIQFGENLTRQEAEWVVFELRSWLSQHG
jgi:Protein kinase domain